MPILTPAERIGLCVANRYRLNSVLSSRGMSVLFHADDVTTETPVVVKMLKPNDTLEQDRIDRFLRETRIAAALKHPNIATVLDVGSDDSGAPFLVMELLRGRSLEEELTERSTIPFSEALEVVLPIANALASTHSRGVIHRDVKPGNIFLCRDGTGAAVPKLLDFGIAKNVRNDFETTTGLVVGTPSYMAPEQASNKELGPFTDIWGIAAVLYRCLTGRPPHLADSVPEILAKLIREPVPPLEVSGVGRSASATIDRALERDPHDRYRSMGAFVDALTAVAGLSTFGETTDVVAVPGVDAEETPLASHAYAGLVAEPALERKRAAFPRVNRQLLGVLAIVAIASVWAIAPQGAAPERAQAPLQSPPRLAAEAAPLRPLTDPPASPAPPSATSAVAATPIPRRSRASEQPPSFRSRELRVAEPAERVIETRIDPPPSREPPFAAPVSSGSARIASEIEPGTGLPYATQW